MATKLNKVFLNPTEDQISEYSLVKDVSWFTDMDALAAAIEADKEKKAAERVYSLKNFQIIDGARDLTANLSKIAKQTGFTLSNDLSKVLDYAKTEIDYDVDHVVDHRYASTAADGTADLSQYDREAGTTEIARNAYPATAAGQKAYEDAVQAQKDAYDASGSPADTTVIGYQDLTLTNVGSKATSVEEGETFDEKKTVVTQYSTVDVEGGNFTFDYQYDSSKAVDKKDVYLVTETGKESATMSAEAVGSLTVKDSVIGSVTASLGESATEIKSLHKNDDVKSLIDKKLLKHAGAYETVTIDNSTVQGNINGGKYTFTESGTFSNETFLDKPEESGQYYSVVSAETNLGVASANKQLYIAADDTSALTEADVKALQDKGLTVTEYADLDNIQVNKYEIVTYDVNGAVIESGSFVYLSTDEFANLSGASQRALNNAAVETNVGWVDYSADRVVTDANFQTFTTAPAGAAASTNVVNKYVFEDTDDTKEKVTYYLTAAEEAGAVGADIKAKYETVVEEIDGKYRRVAADVTVENYKTEAKDAYSTVSTTYKEYTVTASMSDEAASELNKETIPAGFAWVNTAASADDKALFAMSQFTKSGVNSVETKYYLSASEMSAMGFFGDGVTKSFDDIKAMPYTDLKKDGWAFTDNAAAGKARVYTNGDDTMYRSGAAATEATLANYTIDKTAVVTSDVPYEYQRFELGYTTNNTVPGDLLKGVTTAAQFNSLVADNLVGADSEFVTVIDDQVVNMYQIYGYGEVVTDATLTVTTDKLTQNGSEINYDATIQEALWEGDILVETGVATLVDGVKTQNTKKYFDQYASLSGEYVGATKAEEAAGEKKHEFITVAEARTRGNNAGGIVVGEVVTDVQAKVWDGVNKKWVAGYIDRTGTLTDKAQDETANTGIFYYGKGTTIYALTEAEATAAAGASLLDSATKLYYYTVANNNGWFDGDPAAKAALGDAAVKVKQPEYRDHDVTIADPTSDISAGAYVTLTQNAQLTDEANWIYDKAYVTEQYNTTDWGPAIDNNYDRVQIDGKDAFIEEVSGTLVVDPTTTYDAIYAWTLNNTKGGATVDGLTYYMTETEAAAAVIGSGYAATAVFEKTGDDPITDGGLYQYRVSNAGLAKNAYLTYDTSADKQDIANHGAKWVYDNSEAYYDITYVTGEQVYKYALAGDSAVYYLTENEAAIIGGTWGGALTKGDAVEDTVHYGTAQSYAVEDKANFTKTGTVFYFSDSYAGLCISQDDKGAAVQAFDADGEIWSNIDGVMWTVDSVVTKYSNYESELCENTYAYNYDDTKAWTTEQIEQIAAAETAAGEATWKVEDLDGQIVWTRTSAIGEVSTYVMDHENVDISDNGKSDKLQEATGAIAVVNGSVVKGAITGYKEVVVTDSTVGNVSGGDEKAVSTETLSTSKGSIGKDGSRTITTKVTEKSEQTEIGTGSFTISRSVSDKIYADAGDVDGYETVSVTGVDTGDLTVSSRKSTNDFNAQISYQGDADALRSDYIENWDTLAFTKGIVSKVNSDASKSKSVSESIGSAEITGREYAYVPGTQMDTANTVGDIAGFKQVTLTNANAGNILADDSTTESQSTYKLSTKGNVDSASETNKSKSEDKAVAELTAVNSVTNPGFEADLTIGDISGFKTVSTENYSFADADAVGSKTVTTSNSSVREAVASDMRLVNAGVNPNTGLLTGFPDQKYFYGGTTAAGIGTYANDDMSYSSDSSTKRTAVGTLTATGHAYTAVIENYTEIPGLKDQVYAYTQTATGRTVYLTEKDFDKIQSESKADAAQWTKGSAVVYYRNSGDAVAYDGSVNGTQVVYECKNAGETIDVYLTEGELANYNLVNSGDKLTKSGEASLRSDSANKVGFGSNTAAVATASGKVGTVIVKEYSKAGEANQFLTEAEATAGGWTKVDDDEFVRKANAGDDRSSDSKIAKADMDGGLKVYQNKYDSSLIIVLNADEEAFLKDTSTKLDDYELTNTTGYRDKLVNAGISADISAVSTVAEYAATITEAHSYVKLNNFGEVTDQAYVSDAEYGILKAAGKAMDGFVLDDGTHGFAATQYQYRTAGFKVDADTTLVAIAANTTVVLANELYGWALTDEQAAAANVYAPNQKSEFVLSAVTEDPIDGNTTFGNIYGYKDVTLAGMNGGNIYRVAAYGSIAADNETSKSTYKKTVKKGKNGTVTYTETDSTKSSESWSADGTVTLTDSKVGDVAGYKTVEILTDDGTAKVGMISRTTQDDVWNVGGAWDKRTSDVSNKVVTDDSTATFKVTTTSQTKTSETGNAAGSVSLIGQRAGEALELDETVVYDTAKEATEAAQAAIDAWDGKQIADLVITGGVIGYQDVTVENATITANGVLFEGGKYTSTSSENHTTVEVTDNNTDTVTALSKVNDSTNQSWTATGTLTMTDVNYADPNGYVAGATPVDAADYTTVDEYVFNGVTYALTKAEKAALLQYGDLKQKTSAPSYYENVKRENASITTPAVELTGTLQDVVNAKGVNGSTYAQDTVYFAAKAKNGAGTMVDLYIKAEQANELLAGEITDLDDAGKKYTEATLDTSKVYYGNAALDCYKKADFEAGVQVKAEVKKYVVTADGESTTCYLTDAEAAVMTAAGMDVKAGSDTAAYTRMTSVGKPVTVNAANIAAAGGTKKDVFEFRGVEKNTGESVSYYLDDAEAATCLVGDDFASFGKVGTATYFRDYTGVVTPGDFKTYATEAHICSEVKEYADGVGPNVFLTDAEFTQIKAIDPAYKDYAKVGDTKYYRTAATAFDIETVDNLKAKFTSVDESAEVFEVTNTLSADVLGYLSRAELLALDSPEFNANYTVNKGTTYLRAADDTTDIIKINPFKEGDGYVITENLSDAYFHAAATEPGAPTIKADAYGFQTVTLTNADMGDIYGGKHTSKTTDKLAAKKNSTIATYTTTEDTTDIAAGSLTVTDSAIGDATGYEKVVLTAAEMDAVNNRAGDIEGGKITSNEKYVYTSKLYATELDYSTPGKVIEYTRTAKENATATGSAILENVVSGDISGYKDVTVSFDKAIDQDDPIHAANKVGEISGGNYVSTETETYANVDTGSYSETTTKETIKSVGTVTLTNVFADDDVAYFQNANITDSEIFDDLTGGDWTVTATEVDVNGAASSIAEDITVSATGKAVVANSKVGGDIEQFKDVELTGGVEVGGDIIVGGDDNDTVIRGATENTACYAVFFKDSENANTETVVYLTEAEYKVFATKETTAMIDTVVSVYRTQAALTDAELKDVDTAVTAMRGFSAYTDDPVTDGGYGQEGKNTEVWTVKTWGNSLTIDEDGAKVGGKVQGYAKVEVAGDSSFREGFFGTAKNDKLTVDEKVGLATFTTAMPGKNPVGFDFGEGKDELELNGTIGIQAAFKYDEESGTNAWNLETVSGTGTIVCRTEDVDDVKAAFNSVKVVGSDNYNAVTALDYQEYDDARNVTTASDIDEWLGFCDKADYYTNSVGDATFAFSGDSVTSGDIVAQFSVDGGDTWTALKNGEAVKAGAVVRVAQLQSSTKVSNDYTLAFK